jgi:hypothetical protein
MKKIIIAAAIALISSTAAVSAADYDLEGEEQDRKDERSVHLRIPTVNILYG